MTQIILEVPDISCAHCEHTIVQALKDQPGVQAVQVSIPAKTVTLDYDAQILSLDQVRAILDEEGYPVADGPAASAPPPRHGPIIPLRAQ